MLDRYVAQARLLVEMLPEVAKESNFALKGGTAINLFHRDLPRLSVDIDLTWLPLGDRSTSLSDIDRALDRIAASINRRNPGIRAIRPQGRGSGDLKIIVRRGRAQIKIETSPVARGAVHPPVGMVTSESVMEQFGFAEMNVLAFEELYAGKLVAALDRQHPRDLFDVKLLYENEGMTDDLFRTFLVYVASSSRPMHELLAPDSSNWGERFQTEFAGMARNPVSMEALIQTELRLHMDIHARLTGGVAEFLLSLHDAQPDFGLIGLPQASELPAVRWKLRNLAALKNNNQAKHAVQRDALKKLLC
ncbi:MAG: nucleotidyl transferase AbiEii/AbiGii toxin family protein [Gammaproteobacteria bacterium]|nr:nucleotidyl transferase AbiEii/AbiGii toxin family protein [Gammaproteobacteria bacterium]